MFWLPRGFLQNSWAGSDPVPGGIAFPQTHVGGSDRTGLPARGAREGEGVAATERQRAGPLGETVGASPEVEVAAVSPAALRPCGFGLKVPA